MNETFPMRGPQPFRYLDAGFEHLFFRQPRSLFDKIIQTSVIDQFHHEIKLSVIYSRGEDLYDIWMVYGGGDACLLLQSRSVVVFAAEIPAQQFQRHQAVQQRVTRLIHRAHTANAKCLQQDEMMECPFHRFFSPHPGQTTRGSRFRLSKGRKGHAIAEVRFHKLRDLRFQFFQ